MPFTQPIVLILSNDPAFGRQIAAHWPSDPKPPEFTMLEEGLFRDLTGDYDLAIVDASAASSRAVIKQVLAAAHKPGILVHADSSLPPTHTDGTTIELRRANNRETIEEELWAPLAGLLGREILQRARAESQVRHAETLCAAAQAEATLGRYMVEMRHNVNNALTAVLGNAELLSLEPGLPANAVVQADTILNMALRLHEVFQRFSSIEKELSVAGREPAKKSPHAAGAGN